MLNNIVKFVNNFLLWNIQFVHVVIEYFRINKYYSEVNPSPREQNDKSSYYPINLLPQDVFLKQNELYYY